MAELPNASKYVSIMIDKVVERLRAHGIAADTNEGARWDALLGGIAAGFVRANKVQIDAFDDHVLGLCFGAALDEYCLRHGPVRRSAAKAARGYVTMTRLTVGAGAGTIPKGYEFRIPKIDSGTSFLFRATDAVTVASTLPTIAVLVEAVAVGADSNVGEVPSGIVQTFQDESGPATLWDPTLLPTSAIIAGGVAEELDQSLTERQRLYEQARQLATEPAVALAALTVAGVKHVVTVKREESHYGVQGAIYVGDVDWNSTDDMLNLVSTALERVRGFGPIYVLPMENYDVQITGTVYMSKPITRYNIDQLRTLTTNRILEYFDGRTNVFEYTPTSIAGRIERAHDEISSVSLDLPNSPGYNPFTPGALALDGFPSVMRRYRTDSSLINLEFEGT